VSTIDTTILITAYREPLTIELALDAVMAQIRGLQAEAIVICPDDETVQVVLGVPGVMVVRDSQLGKPAALNMGFARASGKIIVMTDGDVSIARNALHELLRPMTDPQVGAVTGRPVSVSPRGTMLGYWSHLLTDAGAHEERARRDAAGRYLICSGYLYAIRAGLITHLPEDALAEDAVVSQMIAAQGFKVRYSPEAKVFVKYPDNYREWLIQKVRSLGGYAQPVIADSLHQMRSFALEATIGLWRALTYPRNLRELVWTFALMVARLHLWLLVWWNIRVQKRSLAELWKRVESTK